MQQRYPAQGQAEIGVVISTLGTRSELTELLESLCAQTRIPTFVGIADQGTSQLVAELEEQFRDRLPLVVVRTGRRGLSAGRNDVIRLAPSRVTHFIFPNDTSRYPADFVGGLVNDLDGVDVGAISYVDDDGPRHRFTSSEVETLRQRDVFKIIEPGMVLRASRVRDAGGFDESIGTGAASPRQSGEGTDLILRMMCAAPVPVRWLPQHVVGGVRQSYGMTSEEAAKKASGYAYGYGFLLRQWRFPLVTRWRALSGPTARALAGDSSWAITKATTIGRLRGMRAARASSSPCSAGYDGGL